MRDYIFKFAAVPGPERYSAHFPGINDDDAIRWAESRAREFIGTGITAFELLEVGGGIAGGGRRVAVIEITPQVSTRRET